MRSFFYGFITGLLISTALIWWWMSPKDDVIASLRQELAVKTEEWEILRAEVEAAKATAEESDRRLEEATESANLELSRARAETARERAARRSEEARRIRDEMERELEEIAEEEDGALAASVERLAVDLYGIEGVFRVEWPDFKADRAIAEACARGLTETRSLRLSVAELEAWGEGLEEALTARLDAEQILGQQVALAVEARDSWRSAFNSGETERENLTERLRISATIISEYEKRRRRERLTTVGLVAGAALAGWVAGR